MARILVLDGHSAAALAFARSAGRAGHWVAVGVNEGLFAAAKLSRYCQCAFDYPVSTNDASAFVNSVIEFARSQSIDLVIPVTDWTLGPISQQRDRFVGLCCVALPSKLALDAVSDKHRTIKLAESLGIGVPRTVLIESLQDLAQLQVMGFPAVVKDRYSVRWNGDKAQLGSVTYAYSPEESSHIVAERLKATGDVLVQEFVAGVGVGFSCFVAGGKVYLPFQWQRIREVDPRGSGSCARQSISLDSTLVSQSARLITEMGFEGVAMVEYKQTKEGKLVLMEINGRPWGSIGLPIACGIDYPRYLVEWCLNGTFPPEAIPYQESILCRRVVGELTHLTALRAGPPSKWPIQYPSFWKSLIAMSVPWLPGMCYDDLSLSDLRPGAAGITNWFRSRMKRTLRRRPSV